MGNNYMAFARHPAARWLLGALVAGSFSFGMVSLGLFLTVAAAAGSVGLAGVAVGAFSLGSAGLAPLRGRLIDRRGARPWLPLLAGGYAASLLLVDVLAERAAPVWLLVAFSAAAGASAPPLIATVRGLWVRTVDAPQLRRAYALTALVVDIGQVAGPAATGLLVAVSRSSALAICALAAFGAASLVAGHPRDNRPNADTPHSRPPFASRPLRVLLSVSVALGAALGLVEVAVPAAATAWRVTAYSGLLLAAFSVGSVAGGLWFGRREWRRPPGTRYLLAALLLGIGLGPMILAEKAATLAPLLVVAGFAFGPATISLFEALDVFAPDGGTEALALVTTAQAIGSAFGASVAGWASSTIGLQAPFGLASGEFILTAAIAFAWHTRRGDELQGRP